jgi:hypothetical protein
MMSEGLFDGKPTAFYDLYRLEEGKQVAAVGESKSSIPRPSATRITPSSSRNHRGLLTVGVGEQKLRMQVLEELLTTLVRRFIYSVTYFKLPLKEVGPICLTGRPGPVV